VEPVAFWPATLVDMLAVGVIVVGIPSGMIAGWKWLIKPLRAADKAQMDEARSIRTQMQSIAGEVHMLAETIKSVENSRDMIQRDLGRLETQVSGLRDETRSESALRNEQHALTMRTLGEISGQLTAIMNGR
jgi:septal ring factor EnvC (AmiA/AmiB activator)